MKRRFSILTVAVLVLGLAVYLAACGGGGGGSNGPSPTPITTPQAGAQSAAASVTTAQNISSSGMQLSGLVATGTGATAPKITTFPWTNTKSTPLSRFVARVSPVLKKSRILKTSAPNYPMTTDCTTGLDVTAGSPNSMTVDIDSTGTSFSITYNTCKESTTETDGVMTVNASGSTSMSMAMGSAGAPFTVTDYTDTTYTTAVDKSEIVVSMTVTESGTTTITDNMKMNGSVEDWDYVSHTHDKEVMNNLSIAFTSGTTSTYDTYTLAIDGSMTETSYVSDTDATPSTGETDSFRAFTVEVDTPSLSGNVLLSMNGMFTISTTPSDACIEGTFSVVTDTPIEIDASGLTVAGKLTINTNTVVTFDSAGGVSVAVDGGAPTPYTEAELSGLCAL